MGKNLISPDTGIEKGGEPKTLSLSEELELLRACHTCGGDTG